jgi:glucokinase
MNVWGILAVNMIHAYGPEVLVLGGGIMKSADVIIPYIKKVVEKYSWIKPGDMVIQHARLGEDASIIGGYYLVEELVNKNKSN